MTSKFGRMLRLYHTLKYLRFEQIWFRLKYKLVTAKPSAPIDLGARNWVWNGLLVNNKSILSSSEFVFLNTVGSIKRKEDWNNVNQTKLWLYNLHYFDDLNASDFKQRESMHWNLIDKWIEDNPPVFGNGWEPYPLSLRIVNWVKWFSRQSAVEQKYLSNVALQADALSQQLEYHILGNHLFANAKALVFAGTYLTGPQADKFFHIGLDILDREIEEQFLPDGAHFELSPMYHVILLWDVLELINLAKLTQEKELIRRLDDWSLLASRGLVWLKTMCHPDGEVSFFNDSAIGIAPSPAKVFEYADKLGVKTEIVTKKLHCHRDSGYSAIAMEKYTAIIDHAQIGPGYLPGHGHADALSFELSVNGLRFLVNSGTSVYGNSPERLRQRKTAAHNTVTVKGYDSSEVWSGFRVARRANTVLEHVSESEKVIKLIASHDGFRLTGKDIVHRRAFELEPNKLVIRDSIDMPEEACAHLHFAPDVSLDFLNDHEIRAKLACGGAVMMRFSKRVEVCESTWHPNFGKSVENRKLTIPFSDGKLVTTLDFIEEYN